jgi:hypothetical protein
MAALTTKTGGRARPRSQWRDSGDAPGGRGRRVLGLDFLPAAAPRRAAPPIRMGDAHAKYKLCGEDSGASGRRCWEELWRSDLLQIEVSTISPRTNPLSKMWGTPSRSSTLLPPSNLPRGGQLLHPPRAIVIGGRGLQWRRPGADRAKLIICTRTSPTTPDIRLSAARPYYYSKNQNKRQPLHY